jgi:hypothetical protein
MSEVVNREARLGKARIHSKENFQTGTNVLFWELQKRCDNNEVVSTIVRHPGTKVHDQI